MLDVEKEKALERIKNYVSEKARKKLAELMPERVYVCGPPAGENVLKALEIFK